jgi:hypothetical protein
MQNDQVRLVLSISYGRRRLGSSAAGALGREGTGGPAYALARGDYAPLLRGKAEQEQTVHLVQERNPLVPKLPDNSALRRGNLCLFTRP